MESLQREIVDERKVRLKPIEPTGVGSMGIVRLGAGLSTSSLPQDFNMPGSFSNVQVTSNYDEIIAREFPWAPVGQNTWHLRVVRPIVSSFRARELEWRRTHAQALKLLENRWVVLEGEEIVAHGEDPVRVINEARSKGIRTPYVFFVEPRSEDLIRIGL